jgi:putative pyruvate formate lyase activating enzyme
MNAAYLALRASGELEKRAKRAVTRLASCELCPRRCKVDRLHGERGLCMAGRRAPVASSNLHFGEEDPLVGQGGSGTVFFAGCNLLCVFCQNFDISHETAEAQEADPERLAGVMLSLQEQGAENINFVTPSHVVPQILEALTLAVDAGLRLPLVYNTGGYDALETLRLLDGVVDIYMPDVKFWDAAAAGRYMRAGDYPERARRAVREMHRQVGDLTINERGAAERGLLVRHLVMPGGLAGTGTWMEFLANEISRETYVNVMDQYRPCGRAADHPEINRGISAEEYREALRLAAEAGLTRLDERRGGALYRLLKRLSWE